MKHTRSICAITAAVAVMLSCAGGPARAQFALGGPGTDQCAWQGPYGSIGFTYILERFDVDKIERQIANSVDASDSVGLNARLGYRALPALAGEVEFEYYNNFDLESHNVEFAEMDGWSVTGNLKGYPVTGRFQPYGLVGVGALNLEVDDNVNKGVDISEIGLLLRFGLGIEFYATRNIVFAAEGGYLMPMDSELEDYTAIPVSVGVQYRLD